MLINTQIIDKIVAVCNEEHSQKFLGFQKDDFEKIYGMNIFITKNSPTIYFLIDKKTLPIYIGQCKDGFNRVKNHIKAEEKKFEGIMVFSGFHGKYLDFIEAEFIKRLKNVLSDSIVLNKTCGNNHTLNSMEMNYIQNYLDQAFMLFSQTYVGLRAVMTQDAFSVLEKMHEIELPKEFVQEKNIEIINHYDDMKFYMKKTHQSTHKIKTDVVGAHTQGDESFEIFKDSKVPPFVNGSCPPWVTQERNSMIESGILEFDEDGNIYKFTSDYVFDTISRAGIFCYASSINSQIEFSTEGRVSHRDYYKNIK